MRLVYGTLSLVAAGFLISVSAADEVKSGKFGGAFQVKAITGGQKGKQLCYVWKYNGERRSPMVLIFSSKADENLASLVKAVDAIQSKNDKVGAVVIGVSGVAPADLEKLQSKHRLTTPVTIAVQSDGPPRYKLNPDAAVTVIVRPRGGKVQSFGFTDTKSASASSKKIVSAINTALN